MSSDSRLEPPRRVFDGPSSRRGRNMNRLFMSLRKEHARADFRGGETAYCERFGLSEEQRKAVLERDWQAMLDLGGSIFYIYKLAMMDGLSM